jgi:hypothetical protein
MIEVHSSQRIRHIDVDFERPQLVVVPAKKGRGILELHRNGQRYLLHHSEEGELELTGRLITFFEKNNCKYSAKSFFMPIFLPMNAHR